MYECHKPPNASSNNRNEVVYFHEQRKKQKNKANNPPTASIPSKFQHHNSLPTNASPNNPKGTNTFHPPTTSN